jgi:hypothetical protein
MKRKGRGRWKRKSRGRKDTDDRRRITAAVAHDVKWQNWREGNRWLQRLRQPRKGEKGEKHGEREVGGGKRRRTEDAQTGATEAAGDGRD